MKTKTTDKKASQDERIAKMPFATVYPYYVAKVEKKGRTKAELHRVIEWLTGYDEKKLQKIIEEQATFEEFFQKAKINPGAYKITGIICGYRVEEIQNPTTRLARCLDKLVDELAKGRPLEKILRAGE
ncbi:MAG: DUF2200 domain-containing protein [Candidatus Saccharicenans sp.]|nr:DUF2200 domain-containing protein [Candidatus Saccharicenans sp.]